MSLPPYPDQYLLFNQKNVKRMNVVLDIDGLDLITTVPVYTKIRYGDIGLEYGQPGIVYGGLRLVGSAGDRAQRSLLNLDGGLVITQRIEPEQGRGAISTVTLKLIDKDKYVTEFIAPGVVVDEIMGRKMKLWVGYQDTSWPEDYFVAMRGRITQINYQAASYQIQFSDANLNRNAEIFFSAMTKLSSSITDSDTTIPVISNGDFNEKIVGPDGTYDDTVSTYIKIDDEWIEYQQTGSEGSGFGTNEFIGVVRGARGTTAVAHDADADVSSGIQIQDNLLVIALKLMLSGWNGNWIDSIPIKNLADTQDVTLGVIPGAIILPDGVDAVEQYGLAIGDFVTVSGDTFGANDGTYVVQSFQDLFGRPNQIIVTDASFITNIGSPALLAFRSQFDTYPTNAGAKIDPQFVDVAGHIQLQNTFLGGSNEMRFFITDSQACKSFIESELFLPAALYSITRQGRLSVTLSKPPLADERFILLDKSSVKEPDRIRVQRGLNNRKFFNRIDYELDADDSGNFTRIDRVIDSESVTLINTDGILPIKSKGSRTDLGFDLVKDRRTRFILQRYSRGAILITMKVNWEQGSLLETGDVLGIIDGPGDLQIPNFGLGQRYLGSGLFEVIDRKMNIGKGEVELGLLGDLSGSLVDKYATISPSSRIDTGSTTTRIRIKDSFGVIFPGDERRKWEDYVGLPIRVHDDLYTYQEETVITSLDLGDAYAFNIDPPLSGAPPEDYIVDIADYPTSNDPNENALYKLVHAHLDPSVDIVSGTSDTEFEVALADAAKFQVGLPIYVHSVPDYAVLSPEVLVEDVSGTTITVDSSLGFTPVAGQRVELIGFADGGQPYRFI